MKGRRKGFSTKAVGAKAAKAAKVGKVGKVGKAAKEDDLEARRLDPFRSPL